MMLTVLPAATAIGDLAGRIRAEAAAVKDALQDAVCHAVAGGRLLREAKWLIGHGGWGRWLEANFEFSARTARTWMQLADEWDKLDEPKRQRVAEMPLRQALAFIAEPRGATPLPWSGEVEWYTPAPYVEAARAVMGGIDCDPASSDHAQKTVQATVYYTAATGGLTRPWFGRVFLNPPYRADLMVAFTKKLRAEIASGNATEAILLVHARTDAEWFHDVLRVAAAVCFTLHRISFETPEGPGDRPTTGSAFLYFGPSPDRFARVFGEYGSVVQNYAAAVALRLAA